MRRPWSIAAIGMASLATAVVLVSCSSPSTTAGVETDVTTSAPTTVPDVGTTVTTAGTTSSVDPPTTTESLLPPRNARYVVPENEVEREAKQIASDIAYSLTTYDESDHPARRFIDIAGLQGLDLLTEASEPLTHRGQWSRGEVLYPQLGGLTDEKMSVMVVTRQTVGTGPEPEFSIVRTLDVRLRMGESGWEFEELSSAGGVFDSVEDLELAHAVAADPRIEMPDSARLDIRGGEVSPLLLKVMLEIADIAPYGITVMATGHPYHVFETNRVSHHTIGRAIDIHRVGDRNVIDDREVGSTTYGLVQWLWGNPEIIQVGSPWDLDAGDKKRSFENTVHQDHIHVAVIGANDPTWVPALGDLVWEDLDADGIQDDGEPGIAGVTVRLFDGGDREVASTTTDANGEYEFRNLTWGDWHIEVDIPSGYRASPQDRGSNDARDSDIDATGEMASTFLDPREDDPEWDAGLYRPASIGDRVWEDLDADGLQDAGEPGIGGVTVRLFDGSGAEVASTTTDSSGIYAFSDLTPGPHRVEIDIPAGFVTSPRDRGGDDAVDSDVDAGGVMTSTTLESGEDDTRWDAGLYRSSSIGGIVWDDLDLDGIRDPGEPGIGGVTVRLFGANGTELRSILTDVDGEYEFRNLRAGEYHIEVDLPDGLMATLQDGGTDDLVDSDIDVDGVMEPAVLGVDDDERGWDAGLRPGA